MWATFPINIHLFCSFLLCWNFLIRKKYVLTKSNHNLKNMLFPAHFIFFFCSQYEVHLLVVIRVTDGSFSVYSRYHMVHFKHTLWSVKYYVYKCVPHSFLHLSCTFSIMYESASYLLGIRNIRSTVELWLHDQNENLLLFVNKMLCWKEFRMN